MPVKEVDRIVVSHGYVRRRAPVISIVEHKANSDLSHFRKHQQKSASSLVTRCNGS